MNKTKIIATIGPASKSKEILKELIYNGMDVVRLNLSHADHKFCDAVIKNINELNTELEANIAVLLDLQGPDVKIGKFQNGSASINDGDMIRIYMTDIVGDKTKFSVNYQNLMQDIKYNTVIKIDDGKISLQVIDKEEDCLVCKTLVGGLLQDNKSINIPDASLKMPFLSAKDKLDISYAHKKHVDYLGLSFVSSSEDVLEVNDILIGLNNDHIGLIAKIENKNSLNEIDDIIRVSDGIMVARGDLGVEIPMERVPGIQKTIISKCHIAGKISIVATELMASMESAMRPTRAEVSDVANAVLDGVDAVMLSGETTIGMYPVETLGMMEKIILSAEEDINYYELLDKAMRTEKQDTTGSIAYSVTECANRLKCRAIVTPTMTGYTARKISRFRPTCPIIAMSPSADTVKSLALYFGVVPVMVPDIGSFDKMMNTSLKVARLYIESKDGDRIIVTGGYPFKNVKHTNFMKIEEL